MAMTAVEDARAVTGGVDTHLEVHVAAALDTVGARLGCAVPRVPRLGVGWVWLALSGVTFPSWGPAHTQAARSLAPFPERLGDLASSGPEVS